jgi:rhamnogalacturonan endolyase
MVTALAIGTAFMLAGSASAASMLRYMEKLDRGLIAVKSGTGYFLSWRLFGTDPQDNTFGFNIYKGTTKLTTTPITNATCYQDNSGGTGAYTVKPVTGGVEGEVSENAIVIDNGYVNIPILPAPPTSSTANDCSIGDLDGDGQYEIVLKWDASNSKDNSQGGKTDPTYLDAYKLNGTRLWRINLGINIRSGAHYTTFLVWDLDGDGIAEVACKTAPGTKDASGGYLKTGPAVGADNAADYRSTQSGNYLGQMLSGPEWYTVFNGKTGLEMVTVNYNPPRYGNLTPTAAQLMSEWEDNYGNRQDRYLGCVAYLDGERPSLVPCRGYYSRTTLWALDWRNGKLTQRWYFDTDSAGNGKDGKALSTYKDQGCHSLREGDVDGDGFDEIVYGACTIDHDGKALYNTGLTHGDALHFGAFDPDRGGLQVWQVHEAVGKNGGIGASYRDAKDGKIIWSDTYSKDNGRGCCAPLTAGVKGWQFWSGAGGLWDVTHKSVGTKPGSTNFAMWWGADLTRSTEDGTSISPGLSTTGMESCNGTKSTPCLTADIFGDWREELVLRTQGNDALHIYTTTTPTTNRIYTLMHDPIYRMSVCSENAAYNQPPEPGIYIGPGMTLPLAKPNIKYYGVPINVKQQSRAFNGPTPINYSQKVFGDHVLALPVQFTGMAKLVTVYDCAGKLVHKAIVKNNTVDLQRDFGMSNGIYVVRVNEKAL